MSDTAVPRALVIGEALIDVTREADGTVAEHPGGSPLNVAVAMSRLGVPTTLATQVGNDRLGTLIRQHLAASGVELQDTGPPGPTSTATATLDSDGAAVYDFDLRWNPAQFPDPAGFGLIHVGSIGAWMPPGSTAVADLVQRADSLGIAVGFDPNIRPSLSPGEDPVRRHVMDIAGHTRFVKLSDEDAAVLIGDETDPEESLLELMGAGPVLGALTCGGRPAVLRSGPHRVEVTAPQVEVVDTIGAGDTYMGALLAGILMNGWVGRETFEPDELRELGTAAVIAAAINCSRPGADPPWRGETLDG